MAERRVVLGALAALPLMSIAAPGRAANSMSTYNWLPTESAPRLFPVRIIRGAVQLVDGSTEEFPQRRNANNGWGKRGSTRLVGSPLKAVPATVLLRWFSWTENSFYEGRFPLPTERIAGLLATPLQRARRSSQPEPFTRLIVGMAPRGFVATWMDAGGEVVELATFQATPVQLPWTDVTPNTELSREAYIADVLRERLTPDELARVRRGPVPEGLFPAYHQRYRWQPNLTGTGQPLYMNFASFNGEDARLWPTGPAVPCNTRPVPSVVEVAWTPPGSPPVRALVTLDEAETLAGFRKLSQGQPAKALTLNIQTGPGGAAVSLQDGQYELPFKAAHSELLAL